MMISVILCTYNRCQSLATALTSLAAQVLPDSIDWEVIIVDNNSRDQTRAVVDGFWRQNPERFRYLMEPQQGKSFALNRGIREARGNVLAFTDDDVTMEPTWLHHLTAGLRSGDWAGAGGRTFPERGFVPPHWLPTEGRYALAPLAVFDMGADAKELEETPFGNNMAFRKELFEKYGGFHTGLGPRAGSDGPQKSEDSEFGERLLAAGERFRYEPGAVVYHSVPPSRLQKKYFLEWWFDKARADIQAFGISDPRWCVVGIPVRLFRRLGVWTLRWMAAFKPRRRFECKIKVWVLVAEIQECYRCRHSAKQLAATRCDVQS